jgi:hypothetical protein
VTRSTTGGPTPPIATAFYHVTIASLRWIVAGVPLGKKKSTALNFLHLAPKKEGSGELGLADIQEAN